MATKPPLRVRKTARTRAAIIDAATTLFEKKGFGETTLNEIADHADVHKQTVLRYFSTKEDIALALRIATLEHFRAELESTDRTEPVIDCWRRHVSKSARTIAAKPDQFRFNQFIMSNDKIVAQLLLIERRYEKILADAFAREDNVDPETDVYSKLLAAMLVSGNFMVGHRVFKSGKHSQLEAACLAVVDFAKEKFPPRDA